MVAAVIVYLVVTDLSLSSEVPAMMKELSERNKTAEDKVKEGSKKVEKMKSDMNKTIDDRSKRIKESIDHIGSSQDKLLTKEKGEEMMTGLRSSQNTTFATIKQAVDSLDRWIKGSLVIWSLTQQTLNPLYL